MWENKMEAISFSDWQKLDLRAGKVLKIRKIKKGQILFKKIK